MEHAKTVHLMKEHKEISNSSIAIKIIVIIDNVCFQMENAKIVKFTLGQVQTKENVYQIHVI